MTLQFARDVAITFSFLEFGPTASVGSVLEFLIDLEVKETLNRICDRGVASHCGFSRALPVLAAGTPHTQRERSILTKPVIKLCRALLMQL